jgi:CheY-like chemotaxis protein
MVVRGDEKRLRQILLNILSNAVIFTEEGHVTLRVEYAPTSEGNEQVQFLVEDTGRGIPADELEEIFLPFQQVGDHTRQQEGTGLGLAITKKLVRLMGGSLTVKSTVGKGSIFGIILPLTPVKDWTPSISVQEQPIIGFTGGRKRILVVDDNWENRAVLLNLVTPLGFEVIEAGDGREGVKKTQDERPDLIVMDIVMPEIDGLEATRQIRELPEVGATPIIASSASAFDFNRQDAIKAGCTDFLPKPIQADKLFEQLRVHLALEWVYASLSDSPDSVPKGETTLIPLPQEELTALLALAKGGKIGAIRKHLAKIEELDDQYKPFLEELRKITKSFDMAQLTKFLMTYVENNQ